MRKVFSIIALLFGINTYAQFHNTTTEGIPSIGVKRQHCVIMENEHEEGSLTRPASVQTLAPLRATGSPKIVVCLAQFEDVKFSVADSEDSVVKVFDIFFNGKDIGAGENPFSVADYFRDMSGGMFTPEFVIMEPITVSKERAYYGDAKGSSRRATFRDEALDSLASKIEDKLSELDTDEDGKIDGVVIVFTGCGANVGDENGMHPACWTSSVKRKGIT